MNKYLAAIALVLLLSAFDTPPLGNRHIQHAQLDMSFYLSNDFNNTPFITIDTPQGNASHDVHWCQYTYINQRDTSKRLKIYYSYHPDARVPFDSTTVYGFLSPEARYNYRNSITFFPETTVEHHVYWQWADSLRYVIEGYSASFEPYGDRYYRQDMATTIIEDIGEIYFEYYDQNYNPADSIYTNRMIDNLFKSIVVKRN
jgi:hypothetical protein